MPRHRIPRPAAGTVIDPQTGAVVASPDLPAICGRIRRFRERSGKEQKQVAREIGVTGNAVSNWENGRSRPDIALIPALCASLGVSPGDLFGLEDPGPRYTGSEEQLVERYRALTPGHRAAVDHLTENLLEAQAAEAVPRLKKLIYYGRALSAGPGDPTEFDGEGVPLYTYASKETERADCVFTVNGDSMEPRYRSGDLVLVSRLGEAPALPVGEVGAFIAGNETYIKVCGEDGLYSLNPAFAPLRFDESTPVYLIGRVTGILDPAQIVPEAEAERFLARRQEG